jgi:hypothetical protein
LLGLLARPNPHDNQCGVTLAITKKKKKQITHIFICCLLAHSTRSRSLQDDPRETYECAAPRWVEQFERKYGGHVVELVVLLYLFVGMAVVIEEYFVECLEGILEK